MPEDCVFLGVTAVRTSNLREKKRFIEERVIE
jgi:hypothetical protein